MSPKQAIPLMVRRIVDKFHPEKIILFGSYARGEANKDSDVDLAVIFQHLQCKRRDKAVRIRVALSALGVPKDVIVLTSDDLEQQKGLVGTIGYILAKEGRLLYSNA
jgi:uncharacterized protein